MLKDKKTFSIIFVLIIFIGLLVSIWFSLFYFLDLYNVSRESEEDESVDVNSESEEDESVDVNRELEYLKECNETSDAVEINNLPEIIKRGEKYEITGLIPGSWCFEGDCAIYLIDWDWNVKQESFIWVDNYMTTEQIGFVGDLIVEDDIKSGRYRIIIHKDNMKGDLSLCEKYSKEISIE